MKYNTPFEYQSEIKRVETIISNAKSYKLKNDMTKYLNRLKKEQKELDYVFIDEMEVVD